MNQTATCIYAALHILGIIIVWAVAISVASTCTGTGQGWCVVGALVAAGIISVFIAASFLATLNRCRGRG